MIDPFRQAGREMARCTCDDCVAVLEFPAMHGTAPGGGQHKVQPTLQNKGSVTKAYQSKGWAIVGRKLICPQCQTIRRASTKWLNAAKEKPAMTNVTELRQPTREQKRQITELLQSVYDLQAERYKGGETDVTIADAIGGGCMFGWVAEIREGMFGPDGGNEEHEALMTDLDQWRANADKLAADMQTAMFEFNAARGKVKALHDRLAMVVKAAGPKAARA